MIRGADQSGQSLPHAKEDQVRPICNFLIDKVVGLLGANPTYASSS